MSETVDELRSAVRPSARRSEPDDDRDDSRLVLECLRHYQGEAWSAGRVRDIRDTHGSAFDIHADQDLVPHRSDAQADLQPEDGTDLDSSTAHSEERLELHCIDAERRRRSPAAAAATAAALEVIRNVERKNWTRHDNDRKTKSIYSIGIDESIFILGFFARRISLPFQVALFFRLEIHEVSFFLNF